MSDSMTVCDIPESVRSALLAAASAPAVVDPAFGLPLAAGDQQAEHGDLDAVAVRVVVEGRQVIQRQRGVGTIQEVVDHRAGDVVQGLDDRARHAGARAQGDARGGDRGAGGLVHLGARLDRQRLGDVDVDAEVVLDPDRPDAGLRQQLRVARGQLHTGPQQRRSAGRARDDVTGQFYAITDLPGRDQTHCPIDRRVGPGLDPSGQRII